MKRIMLFCALFLIVGCSLLKPTGQAQADITGTDALTITLPKLPSQLFPGQGLQLPIILENTGAKKIDNAILSISGYDENLVHFSSPTKFDGISLEGRSTFSPVGEKTTKIFTISSISLPAEKQATQTFEVLGCYPYTTEASPVVCINPQLAFGQSVVQNGCSFVDAQLSPSQGAPVAVTKVETWYYGDQHTVEFRIFVKDVANKGVVVIPSAYAKRCLSPDALQAEDLNTVKIEAYLAGQKLPCYIGEQQTETATLLTSGTGYAISCKAQIDPQQPAYTTILSVYLDYGYITGKTFSLSLQNPSLQR